MKHITLAALAGAVVLFVGAGRLLLLADALACPRRDRRDFADRRRACRQRLDVQRSDRRVIAS